jgi:hypothetical protein
MRWFRTSRDDEDPRFFDVDRPEALTEFSAFAEDLRTAFPEPRVADAVQREHLFAMAEAARPEATSAAGHAPSSRPSRSPTPRRSPVFKSLAAKITAVAAVAFASLGGLATAGALPASVQHGVARVADSVGLNLPDPDEEENQSGDQGTSGDNNEQTGENDDQTDQSGDQGTAGDSNEQSGDNDDQTDQSDDQGTAGDTDDQAGEDDQGAQGEEGSSGGGEDGSGGQGGE